MQMVHWTYEAKTAGRGIVLADGCCDVIVETRPGAAPEILTTGLDAAAPRSIRNTAGLTFSGIRLPPGVAPPPADLLAEAATSAARAELLGQTIAAQEEPAAIAACLAGPGGSLSLAAAMAGVSPRSLQRHLRAQGGPPPDFWRLLGRARRAAHLVGAGRALADAAFEAGYSDQAHMSRALHRWIGAPPAALRADPVLLANAAQPGPGNWMAEQISAR